MIINIDPSYRVSVGRCEGERGGGSPHSVWMLIGSMSFRGSRMDGSLCVGSVAVTRPERLRNPGSTSLSSSLYFYPFFPPFANNLLAFELYNEHACENACINGLCECVRRAGQMLR